MNKAQLIEALAERLGGDKKTASEAVDGMTDIIVRTVNKGEKVNVTGFGVFEKRARAARVARNPRTGEQVKVKRTNVPAFRAGTTFKEVIGGVRKLPRVAAAAKKTTTAKATTTRKTTAAKPAAKRTARTTAKAAPKRATTAKRTTARKTTAKAAPKRATTAKRTTAKAATARKTTARATARKATTRRTTRKK
ncbi:hypothetical protein GCM10012275_09640 [Longimycelium tulufanense]|uniref:DNA-binding protein HU-beta n=1 Tax=Longimycelium tulufanense TaxID=907463 RepID=A0A8J3C6M4_9PSEU|nr:HU family DNA-binding protein [Longimycelium tulufanense]GGM40736.1 hypothetical protein GCM10012275_09640 [Longimycelium tulufanense]